MASAFSGSFSSIGGSAADRMKMSPYDEYPVTTIVTMRAARLSTGRLFFWVHQTAATRTATMARRKNVGAPLAPASVGSVWTTPG